MDFRIFIEPQQGATYETQLAVAQKGEALGYDAFFRSDHYLAMSGDGLPGPTDSWVTLGALARETSRIRLGTLVTSATFRHPGLLAIQVAQVDDMSGGRVELGLGAGWFEAEHTAYGVPFPAKKFGAFEEQLDVITGLWNTPTGERFSYSGEHYRIVDSPALPKPVQHPVPIIIGGSGASKTPALAVKYAAEYNTNFTADAALKTNVERVRATAEAAGRDPESLVYSVARTLAVGTTEAEASALAQRIGRDPAELAESGWYGSPQQLVDQIGRLTEFGISRVYFQLWDIGEVEQLDLVASEVMPHFA
ncbi:LLM class F420-dependent oxidoreductase [Gryllotalpicola protaetiae]|uniref:LLM class F420-dependent oxidoreductase n=1 Tax=Gryllotalpicola protaetiae TaxID=2419771 RepID=A0A387BN09_9MICO|nr:LLM class F420-dependent oxidoreductase [Gryllotalpicola protaetiae]AYG02420.1 LLM class F420-dependent oxidoreductase [Gryllotalpicola protaetiae]